MLRSVTQNLQVTVVPVNNPLETNKYDEPQGYYCAYVSHDYSALISAKQEWHRGIVPSFVGFGSSSIAGVAVTAAIADYENKFGKLCIDDTEDPFGDNLPVHKTYSHYMVLNDGETFTSLSGCKIVAIPDDYPHEDVDEIIKSEAAPVTIVKTFN